MVTDMPWQARDGGRSAIDWIALRAHVTLIRAVVILRAMAYEQFRVRLVDKIAGQELASQAGEQFMFLFFCFFLFALGTPVLRTLVSAAWGGGPVVKTGHP
jgi:hypothetical protein